jgi:hypothetical protein
MDDFSIAVLSLAACVFGASAAGKLVSERAYRSHQDGLRETGLVSRRLLPTVAALLSGGEVLIAAALAAAAALSIAAAAGAAVVAELALAAAAVLTAILAGGVAVVVHRGTTARCACFGAGNDRPLGVAHLARNLSLLTAVGAGLAVTPLGDGSPAVAGAIIAAGAGAVAALLFIRWEDLAELFAPMTQPAGTAPRARRAPGGHR